MKTWRLSGLLVVCFVLWGCRPVTRDRTQYIPPQGKYDVRILRDTWGVPHLFGKTDADVAYGFAYAQCEDDWRNMEDNILLARGLLASVHGREWAKFDYLVQLFRVRDFVNAKYETDLSPDVRALLEAYAEGINHFAAMCPEKLPDLPLPVTGRDIAVASAFKAPFFYELQDHLMKLFGETEGVSVGRKGVTTASAREQRLLGAAPIGSNAWAVGRSRSADGAIRLAVNSHMPWVGPVTFAEAHLHSEAGWNMIGGTFPGGPALFIGHDENKGWCHTVNRPDLADIYKLEINPANKNQYKFDGEWRDFERGTARIKVKLWGPFSWTFKREILWSVHGPAVRQPDGTFAIRFAGYGEIAQVEQWYRMNKARNFAEFMAAMRSHRIPSLNTVYADKDGNLFYAYGGQFPIRAEGYDWKEVVPGNISETLWREMRPFEDVPQILNPPSGFIQSCNNSPYRTTVGEGNPKPEQFSPTMGIQTYMTNRSLRALETYGADPAITRDEFYAYKFDKAYSPQSAMGRFLDAVFSADVSNEPLLQQAVALLKTWDRTATESDTAAALAMLAAEPCMEAHLKEAPPVDPVDSLRIAAKALFEKHGRLDVPLNQVLRLRRGNADLPLSGGHDCLRAIDSVLQPDGALLGVAGDCYILMVEWDKEGKVRSESVHQFGAATLDEHSPHYADQAPLFAREQFKPTLLTEEAVRANLEREYLPGSIPDPWYAR